MKRQNAFIDVKGIPEAIDGARRPIKDVLEHVLALDGIKEKVLAKKSVKLRFAADGRKTTKAKKTVMCVAQFANAQFFCLWCFCSKADIDNLDKPLGTWQIERTFEECCARKERKATADRCGSKSNPLFKVDFRTPCISSCGSSRRFTKALQIGPLSKARYQSSRRRRWRQVSCSPSAKTLVTERQNALRRAGCWPCIQAALWDGLGGSGGWSDGSREGRANKADLSLTWPALRSPACANQPSALLAAPQFS